MKTRRTAKSAVPFPTSAVSDASILSVQDFRLRLLRQPNLLERWRRLATGLRGVRLYHVTGASEGGFFWQGECTLHGKWVSRRFASELHARAWLSVATQPRLALSTVERAEVERPCSSSCFATGG